MLLFIGKGRERRRRVEFGDDQARCRPQDQDRHRPRPPRHWRSESIISDNFKHYFKCLQIHEERSVF